MNFIDNIEIKNFKSIRHQKIEGCKRINVFIGYPNVGKSNILEALGLLTFIRTKRPLGIRELIRFDRVSQLFSYSKIAEKIEISFNDFYTLSFNYKDEEALISYLSDNRNQDPYTARNYSSIIIGKGSLITGQINGIDDFSGFFPELSNLMVKPYKFISSAYFENSMNKKYSALELKIPSGDNLCEVVAQNRDLFKYFSNLLLEYNAKLYNDNYELKFELNNEGGIPTLYPLSLLADTLVRLVFFRTAISTSENSVLVFEEPEAHMFPPYIKKLTTDILFDKTNQFFLATHSPYVLDELILEGGDNLSVYLVDYKAGETIIHYLSADDLSEIRQYGVDLFFNIESYLKHGQVNNS
jgi:AAA15 family ATPase/GTPase